MFSPLKMPPTLILSLPNLDELLWSNNSVDYTSFCIYTISAPTLIKVIGIQTKTVQINKSIGYPQKNFAGGCRKSRISE